MKKIIAILSATLMLTLLLTACGVGGNVGDDIIGTWETTKGAQAGGFVFNVGGGGKILSTDDSAEITWSAKDNMLSISIEDTVLLKDAEYAVNGNELSITYNGITEVFTKK